MYQIKDTGDAEAYCDSVEDKEHRTAVIYAVVDSKQHTVEEVHSESCSEQYSGERNEVQLGAVPAESVESVGLSYDIHKVHGRRHVMQEEITCMSYQL